SSNAGSGTQPPPWNSVITCQPMSPAKNSTGTAPTSTSKTENIRAILTPGLAPLQGPQHAAGRRTGVRTGARSEGLLRGELRRVLPVAAERLHQEHRGE